MCAIACSEFAEQAPGVGFNGVLGYEQLPTDLGVALAVGHAAQHLHRAPGHVLPAPRGLARRLGAGAPALLLFPRSRRAGTERGPGRLATRLGSAGRPDTDDRLRARLHRRRTADRRGLAVRT